MYQIYYQLHSPFLLVNWDPYVGYIFLIELLLGCYIIIGVFVQCWCYKNWLYCAHFALENAPCIEFFKIFPYDIFICIEHFMPFTHGLSLKDKTNNVCILKMRGRVLFYFLFFFAYVNKAVQL